MDPRPLVFLLILLACSMFFSASETAFTATPIHKVSSLLRKKKRGSKELYKLKLKPDRMLIAILVGNNVVNIAAASLATVISLNISKMIGYSDGVVITISTIVVTILVLLFGEILPKTFASRHAERVSLLIAPFYIILIKLLYPIILILEAMMKKVKKKSHSEDINQEDLEAFIDISGKAGIFSNNEDQKIKKLIGLQDLTAEEVMTPRVNIKALDDESTLDEAISYIISNKYSRIPIYHEHIDAIDRITTLKELLRFKHHYEGTTLLKNLKLSPIIKVPTSSPVNTLLEQFQKTHKHLALVIDEYGGVDGVVSLEDIIEEIF